MDPIKLEKYQAMKRSNSRCNNFLSSLIQYSLLVIMLGLFLSSPLWLSTARSSVRLFFIESLPNIVEIVLGPKCLFLVFNLIIIFLVGESRLSSSHSNKKPDIYENYVIHFQGLNKGLSSGNGKVNEGAKVSPLVEDNKENEKEEAKGDEKEEERELEEEKEVIIKGESEASEDEEEREERGLPAEELNKRVEDFIARVNLQRRLEARMLVCCG